VLGDTLARMALERAGASWGDPARRREYLLHQYPGDRTPAGEPSWAAGDMGRRQSGCLLTCRGTLAAQRRADGSAELDGLTPWHGRQVDLLRCTYGAPFLGLIEPMLLEYGRHRGVLREGVWRAEEPPPLAPGDILTIGNLGQAPKDPIQRQLWLHDWGGLVHGFMVVDVDGLRVGSVDGGQSDRLNSGFPTAIRRVDRTLERRSNGWWLVNGDGKARRCNWLLKASELAVTPAA